MMALSELMDQLQSKGVKISLKPNYKKYYKNYPHIIRFNRPPTKQQFEVVRFLHKLTKEAVKNEVPQDEYKIRSEYYNLNFYCYDLEKVLSAIPHNILKEWQDIELGQMEETVREESSIKPNLPRAETTVVKKLPHGEWRYRVHWPSNYRSTKNITIDQMSAIVDHINNDPNSKSFSDHRTKELKRGINWGTRYFYTNSEDILCIISLINPLFIKRIEKFTTLEELNEKATS